MKGNLVNLNVNPCKMCMPMGAVTAMYGIKKCVSILHGSQGCSTYIRRHMATHYNEPVDIASSSLTEEGTVYGGEKNLIQGLLNLIKVYDPEVIGVATTCLAETIGEDVRGMIDRFYEKYPQYRNIVIIPISSAGYGGTQFEGFQEALYQIVRTVPMDAEPNNKVNVVTSRLSPADTRYLKDLLGEFGLDYILLPDLSENLDGVYQTSYSKLPSGGTDIREICKTAGARITLELISFAGETKSVAGYLKDNYGVPYIRCNPPTCLRDSDDLLKVLEQISGKKIPEKLRLERGRYIDAMIDSHKYCAEVRAAVYGEPDFVFSTVRLCVENGVLPVIAATGAKCGSIKPLLDEEIQGLADSYFIDDYKILDDVDFQTIEECAAELGVNLLIGNSDGRRIAKKLGVKLVRRGFPVHDHVGGQRLRSLGYEGALSLLDEIANSMLDIKETGFREELFRKYYKEESRKTVQDGEKTCKPEEIAPVKEKTIAERTAEHPCFSCKAHKYARIHLPVAPRCNISCNYCHRNYDCPNESRPGVTTEVLKPEEALQKFLEVRKKVAHLSVMGIAGPGDALANFAETRKTLELIREQDPDITFCLSTNGLMLPQYAEELVSLGVSHVTVTVNAIDPKIGARIYKYIDYMGLLYYGEAAAAVLMSNQLAGIRLIASKGIVCKVNIVMIKGINDGHIPEIVRKVKVLGAAVANIMPMIPVKGSAFEQLASVSEQKLMEMRKSCGEILEQMYHCRQCRADAIGMLAEDRSREFGKQAACGTKNASGMENASSTENASGTGNASGMGNASAIRLAVTTKSGMMVDQHFGHAAEFYIYEYNNGDIVFKERRPVYKYCTGIEECDSDDDRIGRLVESISDCSAVIALRIGEAPKRQLSIKGIQVFTDCDSIEASVKKAAAGLNQYTARAAKGGLYD